MKPLVTSLIFLLIVTGNVADVSKYRQYDPVVLDGGHLRELLGAEIDSIVGFRVDYDSKEWQQVPIQIDEKHWRQWEALKNYSDCRYD